MKKKIIQFQNDKIVTIKDRNGNIFVPLKRIAENIGLNWDNEKKRIKNDLVLNSSRVKFNLEGKSGYPRFITCLPLSMINGYLFSIPITKRTTMKVKEKLILYKKECYDVLFKHFIKKSISSKNNKWLEARQEGKRARSKLSDKIEEFITYAENQGSKNADKYHIHFTRLSNLYLFLVKNAKKFQETLNKPVRDCLNVIQLSELAVVEDFIKRKIDEYINEGLNYKVIYNKIRDEFIELVTHLNQKIPQLLTANEIEKITHVKHLLLEEDGKKL